MGLLTKMNWPATTLLELLNDAEQRNDDLHDVVHLELNNGRDFLVAVLTGPKAEQVAQQLERIRNGLKPEEFPYGATVKLAYHNDPSCIGWAHRGGAGELLSAYGRTPLDPNAWFVIEEQEA